MALATALGSDQVSFTVTSGKPFEGITRSFTSFSQAARESADSRVYAGIHFRSACEDGIALGRKVGRASGDAVPPAGSEVRPPWAPIGRAWRVAESPHRRRPRLVRRRGIASVASSPPRRLHWILRVAVAACFIGHGAFGVITKAAWLPYFAIFGIPEAWAWKLMPLVGAVDISIGVLTLIQPVRAVILYMAFWGFQTACLRPLAGQGIWELLERAGNYGVPLAFLCLLGAGRSLTDWFSARPTPTLTVTRAPRRSGRFYV